MRLNWMVAVTLLIVATLTGIVILGCGAGNVGGARVRGTMRVRVLPVTDVRRELGQVVEFDHIVGALTDPALSEEGRLTAALSTYRAGLQHLALQMAARFPRELPTDEAIRQATTLPISGGEGFPSRAGRIRVVLQRVFYLAIQSRLADVVAKLTDDNPANDTNLTSGAPHDWDAAWAYYHALDDTALLRTSNNSMEFPQFAGTLHEVILRAFLEGQNAILFGARKDGNGAGTRPYLGTRRVRVRQYGGGTPGGARPGDLRPTGPDVAAVLRHEALIRRKLVQLFYLSVIREATEVVLRLEAGETEPANAARARALEYFKGLYLQVEHAVGGGAADSLLTVLSAPVSAPADFHRDRRDALVNSLNQALANVLRAEERVSPVQLRQRRARRTGR